MEEIRCTNIDRFKGEDVEIEFKNQFVYLKNSFLESSPDQSAKLSYCWYVCQWNSAEPRIVYKSPFWTQWNTFEYKIEEQNVKYVFIAYIRYSNSEKRVCRVVTCVSFNEVDGMVVHGKEIDKFSDQDIQVEQKLHIIKVKLRNSIQGFKTCKYQIFRNDNVDNVKTVTNNDAGQPVEFVLEDISCEYYITVTPIDIVGYKKTVKMGPYGIRGLISNQESDLGFDISHFLCDLKFPSKEKTIYLADEISQGYMYVLADLSEAPLFEDGCIDWNIQFSKSPNTYQLFFQSLDMISILSKAYLIVGDKNYLFQAKKILKNWVDFECCIESKNNTMVWNDHGTAMRVRNIIYYVLVMVNANALSKFEIIELKNLIERHALYLTDDRRYSYNHNHGIFQDQALLFCGYILNNDNSEVYIKHAKERLRTQIKYALNSEKVHVENSSSYHVGILSVFVEILEFLIQFNRDDSIQLKNDIAESAEFLSWLCKPNGLLANTGDSFSSKEKKKIDSSVSKFGNDHYLWAATLGNEGHAQSQQSIVYPVSGYYFYKANQINSVADNTWKLFKAGYSSATHKHADDLSFLLYSKGHDILVDTGMYNYMPGGHRDYFISPCAHNTIVVDNTTYSVQAESSYKTGIYDYSLKNEEYDYIAGYSSMYSGVSLYRQVYSMGDITILYDTAYSQDVHDYAQAFHFSPYINNIIKLSNGEIIGDIKDTGYKIRIKQLGVQKVDLNIVEGSRENVDRKVVYGGYLSYGMNEMVPITTVRFESERKNMCYITAISIEDSSGNCLLENGTIENIRSLDYDLTTNTLSFGSRRIELQEIQPLDFSKYKIELHNNEIELLKPTHEKDIECIYEIIDAQTYEIVHRQDWLLIDRVPYDVQDVPDIFVRLCLKSKRQMDKRIIGYVQTDPDTKYKLVYTREDKCLNLLYTGYEMGKNGCMVSIHLKIQYDLTYTIKWYVYKNGAYYTVQQTIDQKNFDYAFMESGKYTIHWYITTPLGDKQYYNSREIIIE